MGHSGQSKSKTSCESDAMDMLRVEAAFRRRRTRGRVGAGGGVLAALIGADAAARIDDASTGAAIDEPAAASSLDDILGFAQLCKTNAERFAPDHARHDFFTPRFLHEQATFTGAESRLGGHGDHDGSGNSPPRGGHAAHGAADAIISDHGTHALGAPPTAEAIGVHGGHAELEAVVDAAGASVDGGHDLDAELAALVIATLAAAQSVGEPVETGAEVDSSQPPDAPLGAHAHADAAPDGAMIEAPAPEPIIALVEI